MLNSQLLSDFIQEFVWRMAKQNWKYFAFWLWDTAIPIGPAIPIFFWVWFDVAMRYGHTIWYVVIGAFLLAQGTAFAVSVCIGSFQDWFLRVIGKPNYFDPWNTPMVVTDTPRSWSSVDPTEW